MSRSRLAGRALTASITATGLLLGSSAGSALAQDDDVTTLRVTTKNIEVTVVDLGPPGKSSGDLYVYTGTVHRNGKRIGRIHGSNTSIRVKGRRETVSGQLTMQLGNGNQIVAGGLSAYPSDDNSAGSSSASRSRAPCSAAPGATRAPAAHSPQPASRAATTSRSSACSTSSKAAPARPRHPTAAPRAKQQSASGQAA